jgi:hypothetical protein
MKSIVLAWFFFLINSWSAIELLRSKSVNFAGTRSGPIIDVRERRLDIVSGSPFRNIWNELITNFNDLFRHGICMRLDEIVFIHSLLKETFSCILVRYKAICEFPIFFSFYFIRCLERGNFSQFTKHPWDYIVIITFWGLDHLRLYVVLSMSSAKLWWLRKTWRVS